MLRRGSSQIREGTAHGKRRRARGRAEGRRRRGGGKAEQRDPGPAYAPEAAMPPAAVLRARLAARGARGRSGPGDVPGAEREGRPAPRSTSRLSGASSRRAARTRREGVSTGPAPPAGLGPRHLHPRPLGRGSENTVHPPRPATDRPSASSPRGPRSPHRSLSVGRRQGASCVPLPVKTAGWATKGQPEVEGALRDEGGRRVNCPASVTWGEG